MDERERRIAANERVFREANERVAEAEERLGSRVLEILCECGDASCQDALQVPAAEYERVRTDRELFLVKPGHEDLAAERVEDERDGYLVVRKTGAAAEVV